MNKKFDYNDIYKKYDMTGEIHIGTGIVKVHDIFDPLPEFMKNADCIFCDPPCDKANINSFYTKADITEKQESYFPFQLRFFEIVDEIMPAHLFVEVFKANKEIFLAEIEARYKFVRVYDSMYYRNPKNKCWVIQASNTLDENLGFDNVDEAKIIELLTEKDFYNCIGDPCMGKGLVGFYANKNNKPFVGTELNKKRLAVLLERIKTGNLIMQ